MSGSGQAFSQRKLRKVIKTKRWNWISWLTGSGKFTEDEFADDRDRLRDFYASNGYVDFEIMGSTRTLPTVPLKTAATFFALNFIGDGLRDALDPKDR